MDLQTKIESMCQHCRTQTCPWPYSTLEVTAYFAYFAYFAYSTHRKILHTESAIHKDHLAPCRFKCWTNQISIGISQPLAQLQCSYNVEIPRVSLPNDRAKWDFRTDSQDVSVLCLLALIIPIHPSINFNIINKLWVNIHLKYWHNTCQIQYEYIWYIWYILNTDIIHLNLANTSWLYRPYHLDVFGCIRC